jgi:hypothetical protein
VRVCGVYFAYKLCTLITSTYVASDSVICCRMMVVFTLFKTDLSYSLCVLASIMTLFY